MKPRITKMSVLPDNCSIFEYKATHIAIDDQGAGEYVTVTQCADDVHGANVICIEPTEWPAIRAAVNKLVKECNLMTNCKRYTEAELQQYLSDGIALLQKENADLLKDKARLDWLADVNNTIGNVQLPRDIVKRNLHSMRAAIDEAMEIQEKESK